MRARYCAYAIGNVDYLIATTHPQGSLFRIDTSGWKRDLRAYCARTSFTGLTIHDDEHEAGGDAFVTFTARLHRDERDESFTERSRFRRDGRRWKYVEPAD